MFHDAAIQLHEYQNNLKSLEKCFYSNRFFSELQHEIDMTSVAQPGVERSGEGQHMASTGARAHMWGQGG